MEKENGISPLCAVLLSGATTQVVLAEWIRTCRWKIFHHFADDFVSKHSHKSLWGQMESARRHGNNNATAAVAAAATKHQSTISIDMEHSMAAQPASYSTLIHSLSPYGGETAKWRTASRARSPPPLPHLCTRYGAHRAACNGNEQGSLWQQLKQRIRHDFD